MSSGSINSNMSNKPNRNKANEGNKDELQHFNAGASANQRGQGMINSLVGATYQQKLLIVMLCHVHQLMKEDEMLDIDITSEDQTGGIFDDIGFRFKDGDQWREVFIQAKHKEDQTKSITWDDLTATDKKAPFALSKYLNSFLQEKWDTTNEPPMLALCTNIELAEDVKTSIAEYSFGGTIVDSMIKSITNVAYKIDPKINSSLCDFLRENSELGSLAKQVAQHIYHKTTVDFRNPLVQKYRYVIEHNIANDKSKSVECYEVNEGFFHENEEFKRIFEKEYKFQHIWNNIKNKGIRLKQVIISKDNNINNSKETKRTLEKSDLVNLATLLAHHIYHKITVDFDSPLVKNCSNFIEQNIATKKQIENGCYVVNQKFFIEGSYMEFKTAFKDEYLKMLEKEQYNFWEDVRNKGIRFKKDNSSDKRDLPKQVEERQLEIFFKSFLILCNTKHEESAVIASILDNNLLPVEIQGLISSEITYDKLAKWILDWMKEKNSKSLKRHDIVELFKHITSSLHFSQLKGMSNWYCNEIQLSRLQCKPAVLKRKKLFKSLVSWLSEEKNEHNGFTVTIQNCNNLPLVVAALEHFKFKLDYIFMKSEWLEKSKITFRKILNVFRLMKFPLIMVIDCKQGSKIIDSVEWWAQDKSLENRKMIMIMDQSQRSLGSDEDILIGDLTEENGKYLFDQNKFMILCGTQIFNHQFFSVEDNLCLVFDVESLPITEGIKCNINEENYQKIKEKYIMRRLEICNQEFAHELPSDGFWSQRWNDFSIPLSNDDPDKLTIAEFLRHIGFQTLEFDSIVQDEIHEPLDPPRFETTTSTDGNFGWDGHYLLRVEKRYSSRSEFSDGNKSDAKVQVISNEAGAGKTFYMTWLARELQKRYPSKWVIKFNLNEHSTDFHQFDKHKYDDDDRLNAVRQLFRLIYVAYVASNKFDQETNKKRKKAKKTARFLSFSDRLIELDQKQLQYTNAEQFVLLKLFVNKFNSQDLIILMDGFDEVTPYYKKVVLKLLSVLETFEGVQKIYVSSRPYDFRRELQDAFQDCSFYRLVEFNIDEQSKYIHRSLLANRAGYKSCERKNQEQIFQVTTRLLTIFLGNFMEVPLFLYMGLDLLLPLIYEHIDLANNTISPTIVKDCGQKFAPLNMIELFFEKKLNIAKIEKTGATITTGKTAASILEKEVKLKRLKNTFSRLGIFAVMSSSEVEQLLSMEEQKEALEYMEDIKKGSDKSGIIEGVMNNVPLFIHRLFSEYFAALWFFSNQKGGKVKDFLKNHVYETNNRQEIKLFLDSMICKGKDLHMSILDHSKAKVESLLKKNPSLINLKDDWGRTPLQLALSYGSKENNDLVCLLLDWTDSENINIKDTYFEWSALDYAHIRDQLNGKKVYFEFHFVPQLLKHGASFNCDETFTRFHSNDPVEMFSAVLPFMFHLTHGLVPIIGKICTISIIENLIEEVLQKNQIAVSMKVPTHKMHEMIHSYNGNLAEKYENKKIYLSSMPIFELCIIADSTIVGMILANPRDTIKITKKKPKIVRAIFPQKINKYIQLAFEFRSINVLRYFYRTFNLPNASNFEQELMILLVYMHENERKFKTKFHKYCARHKIACLKEKEIPKISKTGTSNMGEKRVSQQGELWRYFPVELEIRNDLGIDSGSEFLLSRALETDNMSIVEYLLLKTKANNRLINNQFIKSIIKNCKTEWCCQSSFHFFIDCSSDLRSADENGQTLLHFAVEQGCFNLVKCLIDDYGFKATERNGKEHDWNAFFYCFSTNSDQSQVRKNIFSYMMKQNPLYHCFGELDSNKKSVFYYAVKNNRISSEYIIQRQFSTQLKYFNADQIDHLIKLLNMSGLNAEEILKYTSEIYLEDASLCKTISNALQSNNMLSYTDRMNRNLLHICVTNNWFRMIRCLIEYFNFDATEPNEMENNWNAFFYCVSAKSLELDEQITRKQIFIYMLEKYPMDCFDYVDSGGKSLFYYADRSNKLIANEIFKRECILTEYLPIEKQTSVLLDNLQNSTEDAYGKLILLEKNNLITEKSAKSICNFMKTTGDLEYNNKDSGRNLLHITIQEGWIVLTKCLIENYGFDCLKINGKENNWNAFFYCVSSAEKASKKLNIFTCLMHKHSIDCFSQLDSKGKSIFWYATRNNKEIADAILNLEPKFNIENLPNERQISFLLSILPNSSKNAFKKMLVLEKKKIVDSKSVKIICEYMKTTGDLNHRDDKYSRNLLQIAILNGWFELAKCLVEHYGFNIQEINEHEKKWNAFFYCVCNGTKASAKLTIFIYLMLKYEMDCFQQLDSTGKSVFWYAVRKNKEIGLEIFRRQCESTVNLPVEKQISVLMNKLQDSNLNPFGKLQYLENNNLLDEKHVKSICDYMKLNGELTHINGTGQRNLLQLAILAGWFTLAKCLIEHYGFDIKEENKNENNWNAFFYCVCNDTRPEAKLSIFTYLIDRYPMDCYDKLDANYMSVFCYATRRNKAISVEIFKRECRSTNNLPIKKRIYVLMRKLKYSNLNGYGILCYSEENNLINEMSVRSMCDYMKKSGDLNFKDEARGCNLLQLAIMEGSLILTKCLIEHYAFKVNIVNKKDDNWNAFFYCVSNEKKTTEKLNIFTYLMEQYPMDCFNQLDSKGKSVFWYATSITKVISKEIFKRECKLTEHLPIEKQISILMDKFKNSNLNAYGKLCYLEENSLLDEQSVKTICDYMKTNEDLTHINETGGRNLLQLAICKGWVILAKYLIEHYEFDIKHINKNENNWNTYFYCVSDNTKTREKLGIFTYLMEKYSMDCFDQLDLKGKSVFFYATTTNRAVAKEICKRECKLMENLPIKDQISVLMRKLQNSTLSAREKLQYLEENYLVD